MKYVGTDIRAKAARRRRRVTRRLLVVSTVASAVMTAGACAASPSFASSASSTAHANISLELWGTTGVIKNIFKAYTKTFPKDAQHQTFTTKVSGSDDATTVNALRLQLTSHTNVPSIVSLNAFEVPEFADAGQLTDLTPYVKKYLKGMTPAARALMQVNGKYYSIPYDLNEKLWFYRKDLFSQAGINVNSIKTQAQFIAAGKQLHAKFPNDYIWNLASSPQQYILNEITSGNGTQYFNRKTGKWVVTSNRGIRDAFIAMAQLRASGAVDTGFDDFTPQWQAGLASGVVASTPLQNWFTQFLPTYAPSLKNDWGITTWPSIGGDPNGAGSGEGGDVLEVPKDAPNKAAAIKFLIDMFMTKAGELQVYKYGNVIPSVTSALNDPALAKNSYFGSAYINAYKRASKTFTVQNYDPAAFQENVIINNALDSFLASGSTDPTSALQTAQSDMAAQIGDPYHER